MRSHIVKFGFLTIILLCGLLLGLRSVPIYETNQRYFAPIVYDEYGNRSHLALKINLTYVVGQYIMFDPVSLLLLVSAIIIFMLFNWIRKQ